MKVAATSTNAITDATGLPSLLSSEADLLSSFPSVPTLPEGAPAADSLPADSVSSFDAVLAMFGLSPNLPLPALPNAPSIGTPASGSSEITGRLDPALTLPTASNIQVTSPPGLAVALLPQIPLASAVVEAIVEPIVKLTEPVLLAPTTVGLTAPVPSESQAVEQVIDSPQLLPTSTATLPVVDEASSPIPVASPPPSPAVAGTENSAPPQRSERPLARPLEKSLERPPTDLGLQDSSEESDAESKSPVNEKSPTVLERPVVVSEFTLPPEITAMPRRFTEPRLEAADEKPVRQRHTAEGRPAAELTAPVGFVAEPAVRGPIHLDVHSLTEQLSAAMQTHGNDLSAGRPIELRLQLDPPELGLVRVHLRMTDESVSVRFIAGDEAVTRILESQLPDLRQSLAERGLAFSQCNVSCDSGQRQQSAFTPEPDQMSLAQIQFKGSLRQQSLLATRSFAAGAGRVDVLV